jgi:ribosome-associated heat shock protein Hsp15
VNVDAPRIRLDKWLWAARFFKTRSLAAEHIGHGRVSVNGQVAKPSREVHVGDAIAIRQNQLEREVTVAALSAARGPATVAQMLYAETLESIAKREALELARKLSPEPAAAIVQGRPTKRERRDLTQWQRWSASVDDT